MSALTDLTLAAARDGLRRRDFSARELTAAHLDAIEALNPRLNAFITETPEQALSTGRRRAMPCYANRRMRRRA